MDATRAWPVPCGSVRYIYADNVIEHLTLNQNRVVFSEALRVLQPGGVMRLVTPDVGALVTRYLDSSEQSMALQQELQREGYLIEHQVDLLRFAFQDDGHHEGYLWDRKSLSLELEKAGFVDMSICSAGQSDIHDLRGLESRVGSPIADICVVMEAVKPL